MGTCTSAEHDGNDDAGARRRHKRSLSRRKSSSVRDAQDNKRRAAHVTKSETHHAPRGRRKKQQPEGSAGPAPSPPQTQPTASPQDAPPPLSSIPADVGEFTSLCSETRQPGPTQAAAPDVLSHISPPGSTAETEAPHHHRHHHRGPSNSAAVVDDDHPSPPPTSSSDGLPSLNSDDGGDERYDADGVPRPSSSAATLNPLAPPSMLLSSPDPPAAGGRARSEARTGSVVDSDSGVELSTSRVVIADIKGSPTVAASPDTSRLRRHSAAFSENSSGAARTQSPWSFAPRGSLGGSVATSTLGPARNGSAATTTEQSTPTHTGGHGGGFTTTSTALRRFTAAAGGGAHHRPSTVYGMSSFAAEDIAPASDDLSMLMAD